MAIEMDRLSQAQLMLEGIATHFFTSVGVIQRDAPPVPLGTKPEYDRQFQFFSSFLKTFFLVLRLVILVIK